jgi:hypothetical protein
MHIGIGESMMRPKLFYAFIAPHGTAAWKAVGVPASNVNLATRLAREEVDRLFRLDAEWLLQTV